MKVLMLIRADAESVGGGDVQQMRETAASLRRLGVDVETSSRLPHDPRGFDLVHLFNTTRINETWQHFQAARAAGIPVALSTIWHSMSEMRRYYAAQYRVPWFPVWWYSGLREVHYARRSRCRLDVASFLRYRTCQRRVAAGSDVLLPNSATELRILESELGVKARRACVIPNGFNVSIARAAAMEQGTAPRSGVVSAGRIEPRKNPLGVIRAFSRLPAEAGSLRFYGALNTSHGRHAEAFRTALVPGRIEHAGKVDPTELYRVFARSKVAVLASFYETTGLAALEALACGTHIVVSDSPYSREYFRDLAFYCDPYDDRSISDAIARALAAPPLEVPDWIHSYTWDQAGRLTREAYEAVLRKRA